ncbi:MULTISPECIES: metal-dependent transcriptional regulator [Cellulophaga]|uniref:Transcriptional regulator MntR n=2 Tax=Cellulophaga TaxID=104264 RepID=F0RAV4_CELLC|nr:MULTISPECIES: metal-dependent transcriptional regulator [Cellulophaga]ADY29510.1 iron (metal) dependent repressor, DtxR family [Cellulophaga lytica DSM 7489]AIM60520.1 iron-dependent repressor [Cellulophaga lytica]APU10392.1 iron-dependent repressor [Cellulophaga lytica]EWH13886.1 DtxR family iron (metal) dependent repressor [Cellulophaga geojensis KL-A]MDO6852299.1 metal-dependent transcriptional regulator [Cellulophaga lytica]
MTHSEENYLKAIFHIGKGGVNEISTNAIAEQMETKPSSVTDMIKKLSEKNLVNYKKYKGVSLTDTGKSMALSIIRKHRLWEVFLVEKLEFSWDEVHEVAEQLEHIKSEKLIDKLDKLLDYPKYDPHGDPIPDKNGNFKVIDKKLLSELSVNDKGICVGVKDSSSQFLKFLDKNKIALGDVIEVIDKEDFDGSFQLKINANSFNVSNQIASNLFVQITE